MVAIPMNVGHRRGAAIPITSIYSDSIHLNTRTSVFAFKKLTQVELHLKEVLLWSKKIRNETWLGTKSYFILNELFAFSI